MEYCCELRPLTEEEGGGWLCSFPDLPGCMSDGETPEEALANAREALACMRQTCAECGRAVPPPGAAGGKLTLCLTPTACQRLSARAERDGLSLEDCAAALLAKALGEGD